MKTVNVRRIFSQRFLAPVLLMVMACAAAFPASARAEDQGQSSEHIVSAQVLQQKVEAKAETRHKNIENLRHFFQTPLAQRAMKMQHVDPAQVQKAIPTLSDAELANLSARATSAQQGFAAGSLSTEQILLIIIVMLFIIILVAIH